MMQVVPYKMIVNSFLLALFVGVAYAQTDPSASDVLKALPADLQSKINESLIKDVMNKSTDGLKMKCEKNGGDAEKVKEALDTFGKCVKDLWNITEVKIEIEKAKPEGRVDEVFKKYCDKRPVLMDCVRKLSDAAKQCLSPEERIHLKSLHNATEQLVEFVCFKDGDRIALFISEHGPECINEKQQMIQECMSDTYNVSSKLNADGYLNTIPEIKFGEEQCNSLNEVQSCIVKALETCEVPTSANIVESLFNFARKSLPCKERDDVDANNQKAEAEPNSGSRVAMATLTAAAAIFINVLL